MRAGCADFLEVIPHELWVIHVRLSQCREPDDGVHRCADVVRHAAKEGRLGLICVLRCLNCFLECLLLLNLLSDYLVHIVVVTSHQVATWDFEGRTAAANVTLAEGRMHPKVGVLVSCRLHAFHAIEHRLNRLRLDVVKPRVIYFLRAQVCSARDSQKLKHTLVREHGWCLAFYHLDAPGSHF